MSFIVTSTYPVAGSTDFPLNDSLEIIFSNHVDESTITHSSVILYKPPYDLVPVALSYDPQQKKILINPDIDLLGGTAYELLIVGDVGGVRDVYGADLTGGSYRISFTTIGSIPAPSGTYVIGGEYFIDASGVWGTGTEINPSDGAFDSEWEPFYTTINLTGLTLGMHTIYVHGQDNVEWGTMQEIAFEVTNSGPARSTIQDTYVANVVGPATMSLIVSPGPTAGAPSTTLTGIITTRTFVELPISAEYPCITAMDYLEIISISPAHQDSLVDPDHIEIVFNADLLEDFND